MTTPPQNLYEFGIWLKDQRDWATLPPRLCKPTPHNTNLVPELINVMWRLIEEGHEPEIKRIPKAALRQMRKDARDGRSNTEDVSGYGAEATAPEGEDGEYALRDGALF